MTKLETFSLVDILEEPMEEDEWIVDDLIAPGLHLLVGPPKVGKSWLSLQMGVNTCQGKPFLGFETIRSDVLYLALEDTRKRIKRRAWSIVEDVDGNMDFATKAETVSTGLIVQIEEHLAEKPQTRLVIVDTFQMVRNSSARENAYAADYKDLTPLKKLADKHEIAVIVIHHTRKMGDEDVFNTVSGTTGITGCADSTMVISDVNRIDGTATLSVAGRDREFLELKIQFSKCQWHFLEKTSKEELEERDIPDVVLQVINFVTSQSDGAWVGLSSELVKQLGLSDKASVVGMTLAKHSQFMRSRGVSYTRKRVNAGSMLELRTITPTGIHDAA